MRIWEMKMKNPLQESKPKVILKGELLIKISGIKISSVWRSKIAAHIQTEEVSIR